MTGHIMNRPDHIETGGAASADDAFAVELRGFGPSGIVAVLVILLTGNIFVGKMFVLPIGAALVLVWVRLSRTPWRELGLARPGSWIGTLVGGLIFGIMFKFLLKGLVMPLLGAPEINPNYHFLAGNTAMLPTAVWAMFAAGFGEELVFRGYLFERLGKLLGTGAPARTAIVLITAVWFGLSHYVSLGFFTAEQAAIVGLVFGVIRALTGRIWMLMIAHTAFDLTALAIIYWNLEAAVAHLILK